MIYIQAKQRQSQNTGRQAAAKGEAPGAKPIFLKGHLSAAEEGRGRPGPAHTGRCTAEFIRGKEVGKEVGPERWWLQEAHGRPWEEAGTAVGPRARTQLHRSRAVCLQETSQRGTRPFTSPGAFPS